MVSKLQRAILVAILCASVISATLAARLANIGFGIVAGSLVISGYAWILAAEFVCLWFVEDPAARPSSYDLIRAWCGEVLAAPRVFCWRQPFRSNAVPDHLPSTRDGRRGVLLVHGLVCNRGFWTPWMRRFRRLDHPYIAIDLEPVFASVETYSQAIGDAVARLRTATGLPPVIVAHSMGGLAVRYWLSQDSSADRVHRIITIGTPHHGTWLARFSNAPSGRQMALGSNWLNALASRESSRPSADFTCFYGDCDNVVFPSANSQLAGADNRLIGQTAHVALAFREEVIAEALRWLEPDGAAKAP